MTLALFMELLVKSGLIAGAGLALSWALHFRPARDRVDVLRAASVLVVLLPLAVVVAPRLSLPLLAPAAPIAVSIVEPFSVDLAPIAPVALSGAAPITWPLTLMAIGLYVAVAALLTGRFLVGVWTLSRWTRSGSAVRTGVWAETLARLDPKGAKLVASPRVEGPLSWGLPPGVVLIGDDSLGRPDQARAVLAHELAHIRRRDWIFLAVSRLAVALFWFNPLVWWLHHELSARTEDAADAAAVADIEPGAYARALLDFASDTASPAALALGGDYRSLKKRISRIMKAPRALPRRPLFIAAAVAALTAVATPIAAVELTRREAPQTLEQEPVAPIPPVAPAAPAAPRAPEAPNRNWVHVDELDPEEAAEVRAAVEAARGRGVTVRELVANARQQADERRAQMDRRHAETDERRAEMDRRRAEIDERLAQADERRAAAMAARHAARPAPVAIPAPPSPPAPPASFARPRPVHNTEALRMRAEARDAARAASEVRIDAVALAAEARAAAEEARVESRSAMAAARVEMRRGADEMDRGAVEMRQEAVRLRDPAHRAQVIADNRARGQTVTDDQLVALSRTMPAQADRMVRDAARMRREAGRGL